MNHQTHHPLVTRLLLIRNVVETQQVVVMDQIKQVVDVILCKIK